MRKYILLLFLAIAAGGQEFDVATIKPTAPGTIAKLFSFTPGGGLDIHNATLRDLIETAFDVRQVQIEGGPPWAAQDRFDVTAKVVSAPDADPSALSNAERRNWTERLRLRTRALLAGRFDLVVHRETHVLPVYLLNVDKNGLRPDGLLPSTSYRGINLRTGTMTGTGAEMVTLASILSNMTQRPVLDRTGLIGRYDFTLRWRPEQGDVPTPEPADQPSLFTALKEQLGLRLDSARGPLDVIVIDRAEKPSAN
jgi:bla regulator protein blaR1